MYKAWGRLRKFLCASQKVWTLNEIIIIIVLKVDMDVIGYLPQNQEKGINIIVNEQL